MSYIYDWLINWMLRIIDYGCVERHSIQSIVYELEYIDIQYESTEINYDLLRDMAGQFVIYISLGRMNSSSSSSSS